jgi:hypothetical protein
VRGLYRTGDDILVSIRAAKFGSAFWNGDHIWQMIYQTPRLLDAVFGGFCTRMVLERNSFRLLELIWFFPQWLTPHNVYLILYKAYYGQPMMGLKIQRRVPWGKGDSIIRFALKGNLQGVTEMLYSGKSSLDDVDPNHGRSALHVSSKIHYVRLRSFALINQFQFSMQCRTIIYRCASSFSKLVQIHTSQIEAMCKSSLSLFLTVKHKFQKKAISLNDAWTSLATSFF